MADIYLVTGATGFLGSHVVQQLLAQGKRVRALVLPGDKTVASLPASVDIVPGDVTDMDSLRRFFAHTPDESLYVIHCASIITMAWEVEERVHRINVGGTRNIIDLCLEHDVRKLVYVSTVHAIPEKPHGQVISEVDNLDPALVEGSYAKTKAEATQMVLDSARQRGLHASCVHPSGLCGPGDMQGGYLTQMFIDYDQGHIPAGVKGGYSFADVRDVAAGIVACLEKGRDGTSYILGGHYVTIRQIFDVLHDDLGMRKTRLYVPLWVARLFLPLFTLWYKLRRQKPVFSRYSLFTLGVNGRFSSERAESELGFVSRPFPDIIKDAVTWLRKEGRISPG